MIRVLLICLLVLPALAQVGLRSPAFVAQLQRTAAAGGNPSPSVWWKLDEGSGTSAADSAGPNTGTLVNSPAWGAGHLNSSLTFVRGDGKYVDVGDDSSLDLAGSWTVALWAKMGASVADGRFMLGKDTDTGRSWVLGIYLNNLVFQYSGNTAVPSTPSSLAGFINDGNWHHYAVTFSGGTLTFYVDGVEDGTDSGSNPTVTGTNLRIGGREYPGNTDEWDGGLDEIKIWNTALSGAQIAVDAGL
jgi:hypothetical protein